MVKKLPIRVLPMSPNEFVGKTVQEVQINFFLGDLRKRKNAGVYLYRTNGLDADPGTVVLFQYDNQIIASATLLRVERFKKPFQRWYHGAFHFDVDSIRVFDPVGPEWMKAIWLTKFKHFSHAKQSLNATAYPRFEQRLTGVKVLRRPAPKGSDLAAPPTDRVKTTVSRIVRDTELTNRVKKLYSYECQICGHTIILADGSRYAEGHHIQPLGKPHNGPDLMDNIVCLCPNCHAACDLGAIRLNRPKLRAVAEHGISQKYIDYHNRVIFCG